MEKNKSSLYPIIGGIAFALCGVSLLREVINYGIAPRALIAILAYFVIAFVMFTKRRDIILPICFSVFTILNLFAFRGGMYNIICSLLTLLASASLAIICFGEFTDYVKGFYKQDTKKLWYIPALILVIEAITRPVLGFIIWGGIKYNVLNVIFEIVGYAFVAMWVVYPDGIPKKVYNVISSENAGIGVDVDTENIINSLYECYCENVKRGLKAPATAVFCKPEELQIKEFEGVYTVSGWVDSQNSYGAMIRTPFTLKMKNENGKIVSTTNINMLGSKRFAANYFTYLLFGIIITAILFGISYFFISGMF